MTINAPSLIRVYWSRRRPPRRPGRRGGLLLMVSGYAGRWRRSDSGRARWRSA